MAVAVPHDFPPKRDTHFLPTPNPESKAFVSGHCRNRHQNTFCLWAPFAEGLKVASLFFVALIPSLDFDAQKGLFRLPKVEEDVDSALRAGGAFLCESFPLHATGTSCAQRLELAALDT
jgi:hypothetical protein